MQDRVLQHEKVTVHFNTVVDDAYPDGKGALAGLHTKDTKSGQHSCICTSPAPHHRLAKSLHPLYSSVIFSQCTHPRPLTSTSHTCLAFQVMCQLQVLLSAYVFAWHVFPSGHCAGIIPVFPVSHETCSSDGTKHVAGEGSKLEVKGLFYGIGHQPNSQLVAGQIDLDDHGYVKV